MEKEYCSLFDINLIGYEGLTRFEIGRSRFGPLVAESVLSFLKRYSTGLSMKNWGCM